MTPLRSEPSSRPAPAAAGAEGSKVGMFVRVAPGTKELLSEAVRGMNEARKQGEPMLSIGVLLERAVEAYLAPSPGVHRGQEVAKRRRSGK